MSSFVIEGGHKLSGEIYPQGAKNETLEVICAVLLTPERVILHNIPDILDVNNLIQLLRDMQVKVERLPGDGSYAFQADAIDFTFLDSDEFVCRMAALRGSVMMIGPLLTRFGKAILPQVGGDKIGRRRLDTHITGFQKLGGRFTYDIQRQCYHVESVRLRGA